MRWIEVSVDTPAELIDERCQQMADMGADGFVIENEADFQNFLENNHQYWDYVDDELEQKFAGVSRIKCYLSDDADGKAILAKIRGAYGAVQTAFIEDSDDEQGNTLIQLLSENGALHIDELCQLTQRPSSELAAILLQLELEGKIIGLAGKKYSLR